MDSNNKLERLRQGDKSVYKDILKDCKHLIYNYVIKNNGTLDEAKGMLQEAIIVLVIKVRNPNFELTSTVCNYLKGVVQKKWLDYLRKENRKGGLDNRKLQEVNEEVISSIYSDNREFDKERQKAFWALFDQLTEKCQKILIKRHVYKIPFEEIAEELGSTYGSVRGASTRCKKKFRDLVKKEGFG